MNIIGNGYDLRFSCFSKNLLKFKQSTFDIALLVHNVSRIQRQIPVVKRATEEPTLVIREHENMEIFQPNGNPMRAFFSN